MKTHILNHTRFFASVIFIASLFFSGCVSFISEGPEEENNIPDENYEYTGSVEVRKSNWNWFFKSDAEERRAQLADLLLEKAQALYGEDIVIKTEISEGRWSPASLLMLLDTIGFVENAYMKASLWRLKPKPVKYGTRYVAIPRENYTDETGFMLVEYKTREELEEELLASYNSGAFNKVSLEHKQSKLPAAGKIFITLGREDIKNAISRWFTFVCTYNDKTIFKTRGTEDIPYVYGTDKLWWNDMSYNVGTKWDGELNLVINDSYQNRDFYFRIVKEIYEIPAE